MKKESTEEHTFDKLDKKFVSEVKLLKHFMKLYVDKQNTCKKVLNTTRWKSDSTEKDRIHILEDNKRLLEVLNKIIEFEGFEEKAIHAMLLDEQNKNINVKEVKEIVEVEFNLKRIKKMLMNLRNIIEMENAYFEDNLIKDITSENAQGKERIIGLLKQELLIFRDINQHYIIISRKIKDYLKNLLEKKPLISVIIPAFNEERLVRRCLNSVLRQTYPNKEVIVVDNKSTDETHKQIAPYTYYYSYINIKGLPVAKNVGAKLAHGDIVVFLDADSMAYKDLLQGIYLCFLEGYNCGKVIDLRGDKAGIKPKLLRLWWYIPGKIQQFTGLPVSGAGACMFCNKKLFFKVGGFNEAMKTSSDTDLTAKLVKQGKFKFFSKGHIITSMRRFEKEGYFYANLADILRGIFPTKIDREWVRQE